MAHAEFEHWPLFAQSFIDRMSTALESATSEAVTRGLGIIRELASGSSLPGPRPAEAPVAVEQDVVAPASPAITYLAGPLDECRGLPVPTADGKITRLGAKTCAFLFSLGKNGFTTDLLFYAQHLAAASASKHHCNCRLKWWAQNNNDSPCNLLPAAVLGEMFHPSVIELLGEHLPAPEVSACLNLREFDLETCSAALVHVLPAAWNTQNVRGMAEALAVRWEDGSQVRCTI